MSTSTVKEQQGHTDNQNALVQISLVLGNKHGIPRKKIHGQLTGVLPLLYDRKTLALKAKTLTRGVKVDSLSLLVSRTKPVYIPRTP